MNRRLARLRAIQTLYQVDLIGANWEEALRHTVEPGEVASEFLFEIIEGTLKHQEEIDECIERNVTNWKMERIGNVDRAVLRLATYEMLFAEDIPLHVSVNEAVELAKAFGGEESSKFVNGVLSKILDEVKQKEREQ